MIWSKFNNIHKSLSDRETCCLEPISEEDADDIIKEFAGDEYDLVDGYVLCDFSGEV